MIYGSEDENIPNRPVPLSRTQPKDLRVVTFIIIIGIVYGLIALALAYGVIRNRPVSVCHQPSVSVLVAAKNAAAHIDTCLNALARQQYSGDLTLGRMFEVLAYQAIDD